MRLDFRQVYLTIRLQSQWCQIVMSPGLSEFRIENVTEQLGVIPAHLRLCEEVYLPGFASYLLLPTVADDFRMPDDSGAPWFHTGVARDDLLQLLLDVRLCIDAVPQNLEELPSPACTAPQESFPAIPIP